MRHLYFPRGESLELPSRKEGDAEGIARDWSEVVTRAHIDEKVLRSIKESLYCSNEEKMSVFNKDLTGSLSMSYGQVCNNKSDTVKIF